MIVLFNAGMHAIHSIKKVLLCTGRPKVPTLLVSSQLLIYFVLQIDRMSYAGSKSITNIINTLWFYQGKKKPDLVMKISVIGFIYTKGIVTFIISKQSLLDDQQNNVYY